MSVIDSVKTWIFSIALKKGLARAIQVAVAFLGAKLGSDVLTKFGLTVDFDKLQLELTAAAVAGLEVLRNWLKMKYGLKWL